jgi:hypothetical protein
MITGGGRSSLVIHGIAAQEVPDALVRVVVRVVERELLLPAALAVGGGGNGGEGLSFTRAAALLRGTLS